MLPGGIIASKAPGPRWMPKHLQAGSLTLITELQGQESKDDGFLANQMFIKGRGGGGERRHVQVGW